MADDYGLIHQSAEQNDDDFYDWPRRGDRVVAHNRLVRVLDVYANGILHVTDALHPDDSSWDVNPGEYRDVDRIARREEYADHHLQHGDMDGSTCLLSRCLVHYPEAWVKRAREER